MRESSEKTLRQVLREAVAASGWTKRALEKRLVLGSGNLDKLLDGRLEIKVRHLRAFAELLDVPLADFVTLGYPEQAAAAKRRLTDWIAPSHRSHEARARGARRTGAEPRGAGGGGTRRRRGGAGPPRARRGGGRNGGRGCRSGAFGLLVTNYCPPITNFGPRSTRFAGRMEGFCPRSTRFGRRLGWVGRRMGRRGPRSTRFVRRTEWVLSADYEPPSSIY